MKQVYKYVLLPDIYDYPTTLELSYSDYEDMNLVALCKNGHIVYYLELLVEEDEKYYGEDKVIDFN